MSCPRCGSRLSQNYITEPPLCVTCGWEYYDYPLPKHTRQRNTLMDGVSSLLRYIGFAKPLMDITMTVHVKRDPLLQAGVGIVVSCPYDGKEMKAIPKSNRGRARYERAYRCGREHRVILMNSSNGELRGWM